MDSGHILLENSSKLDTTSLHNFVREMWSTFLSFDRLNSTQHYSQVDPHSRFQSNVSLWCAYTHAQSQNILWDRKTKILVSTKTFHRRVIQMWHVPREIEESYATLPFPSLCSTIKKFRILQNGVKLFLRQVPELEQVKWIFFINLQKIQSTVFLVTH